MDTKVILATGNKHKKEEMSLLLQAAECPLDLEIAPHSLVVAETGSTYWENAFIKAKHYFDVFKTPALSDDSGLELAALPNILGVETANFGGPENVLKAMMGIEDRKAQFICVLCLYLSPHEIYFTEGRLQGLIIKATEKDLDALPQEAFGQDPIFMPLELQANHETLFQRPDWKQVHSHRAKAVHELSKLCQRILR